jgi:hypothetical protein
MKSDSRDNGKLSAHCRKVLNGRREIYEYYVSTPFGKRVCRRGSSRLYSFMAVPFTALTSGTVHYVCLGNNPRKLFNTANRRMEVMFLILEVIIDY